MSALASTAALGTRPASDLSVTFNREFDPQSCVFPKDIFLKVKDGAQIALTNVLGVTAPFEIRLSPRKMERNRELKEFGDAEICQAVKTALGAKWANCGVKLVVLDSLR